MAAALAANTVRGYRSDWRVAQVAEEGHKAPADSAAISGYLTFLARHGARWGQGSSRAAAARAGRLVVTVARPHRLRLVPRKDALNSYSYVFWANATWQHGAAAKKSANGVDWRADLKYGAIDSARVAGRVDK